GDNGAQVEANLRHYLNTLNPLPSGLPVGAGPPRVKENGCKKVAKDQVGPAHGPGRPRASWSCVVRFGHTPFHVLVALKAGGEVAWVMPLPRHVLRPRRRRGRMMESVRWPRGAHRPGATSPLGPPRNDEPPPQWGPLSSQCRLQTAAAR